MKHTFLMIFLVVFAFACGETGTTLIQNNDNNDPNNVTNNKTNNTSTNNKTIAENNIFRTNNFEGDIPDLTSGDPIVQFGYDFYLDLCERFIECRENVGIARNAEGGIATTASCLETLVNRDHPLRWKNSLDDGRVTYDESKKAACLSSLASLSCEDLASAVPNPKNISACSGVVVGAGADADVCRTSIDCGPDLSCDGCPGTCRAEDQLSCGGELCESDEICGASITCEARRGPGGACERSFECERPLSCSDGKCTAPKLGAPGDNCTDEPTVCQVGYYCDVVCRAYKQLGEDCTQNLCEGALYCDTSKECVKSKETGSCVLSPECKSFNCEEGSCVAPADICLLP